METVCKVNSRTVESHFSKCVEDQKAALITEISNFGDEKVCKLPLAPNLSLAHYRLEEQRGGSSVGVLTRAVERCPQTAELYYLAARTNLNQVWMG